MDRDLSEVDRVYQACVLVLVGVRADGSKELVGLRTAAAIRAVLRSTRAGRSRYGRQISGERGQFAQSPRRQGGFQTLIQLVRGRQAVPAAIRSTSVTRSRSA